MSEEGEVITKPETDAKVAPEGKIDGQDVSRGTNETDEAEARRMGWLPEEEYKGDKNRWRDAKSFLERGRNELPIMRERQKKADTEILELKKTLKETAEYLTKVEQNSYARALKDLKAKQKEAVSTADSDAFDRIEEQIAALNTSIPKAPKIKDEKDVAEDTEQIVAEWTKDNAWVKDKEMETLAYAAGLRLREDGNKKPMAEFLEDVAKEVKRLRPDKFSTARRTADHPTVEGGGGLIRGKGKSFADMSSEAKAACERMAKAAFGDDAKKVAEFKATYVKNYDFDGE